MIFLISFLPVLFVLKDIFVKNDKSVKTILEWSFNEHHILKFKHKLQDTGWKNVVPIQQYTNKPYNLSLNRFLSLYNETFTLIEHKIKKIFPCTMDHKAHWTIQTFEKKVSKKEQLFTSPPTLEYWIIAPSPRLLIF